MNSCRGDSSEGDSSHVTFQHRDEAEMDAIAAALFYEFVQGACDSSEGDSRQHKTYPRARRRTYLRPRVPLACLSSLCALVAGSGK